MPENKPKRSIIVPHVFEHRSIVRNLVVLHILTVFVSFSIGSVLLYLTLLSQLDKSGNKGLQDEIVTIRTMLRAPNGLDLLKNEILAQIYDKDSHDLYIRIIDAQRRIILESPGMGRQFPPGLFPVPNSDPGFVKQRLATGKLYLLKSTILTATLPSGKGGVLQIGADISDDEKLAGIFRTSLGVFILVGLLLAATGAFWIVRKGLDPLNQLSGTVRQITRQHLNTRLDSRDFPVEMQSLVESFNSMFESLDESFTRLTQYTANLAHELRTPINNLMLEADVALSRARNVEEYQAVIGSSMEEYRRLSSIVGRLLFLARAENYQQELKTEHLDVRREIDNIAELYSALAETKGITLKVEGSASLNADPELFRRAVSNLFANGFNYTPPGGRITATVRTGDDRSVEISLSDTGCGIEPEHIPKIFERFYRVDATRSSDPAGSGLGLSIVAAVMKLHGGTAEAESSPGVGTNVILKFPPPSVSS